MEKIYTCEEVAQRYGVKIDTVWAWIRENKLPALRLGKMYRVKESTLDEFENKSQRM